MILKHFDVEPIKHEAKTVREFIDKIINTSDKRDERVFKITTKENFDGKRNLILYIQNGLVKSHHNNGMKFDCNEILESEIFDTYQTKKITIDDIKSYTDDCEEDFESALNKKFKNYTRLLFRYPEIDKETMSDNRSKFRKFSKGESTKELYEIVKLLCENYRDDEYRINCLETSLKKISNENYILNEKIKWLCKNNN